MRRKKNDQGVVALIVIALICMVVYFVFPKPPFSLNEMGKRAVWVSYQDLEKLNYSTISTFEQGFEKICQTSADNYCNTLIVHVRAFQDAMYKTDNFPSSKVITGQSVSYDPLDIMIEIAHQYDLKFEAWINPYRISFNQATYQQFLNHSPISHWLTSQHVIHYGEYQYILNPGSKEARDYIVSGVEEIVNNYDVDGIHFDDYFYVDGTYNNISKQDRLDNVNALIKDVYKTIKNIDSHIVFGISPQGNYENCLIGGADVDTWLANEGYIDYLMPQIYWTNQHGKDGKTKMFNDRVKLWNKIKRDSNVDLYVGLALYQAGKDLTYDKGWSQSSDNINSQIEYLYDYNINGYCLFHYGSLLSEDGKKEMNYLFDGHLIE